MEEGASPESVDAGPARRNLRFGSFSFDVQSATLSRDGSVVPLPPRVTQVLEYLLAHPGELVRKEELLDAAWNGVAVSEQSLSEAIKVLRRALEDDAREPRYIQTVHRRGFRFVGALEAEGRRAPPEKSRVARLTWLFVFVASAFWAAWLLGRRAWVPVSLAPAELVARGAQPDSGSLSPDGQKLAYTSWTGGIVVRDLGSGQDTLLDEHGGLPECPPVWSPDGSRLAYGFAEEHQWQVRIVELTEGSHRIVFTSERGLLVTDWSRDRSRRLLAFFPGDKEAALASLAELYLPAEGGEPRLLYRPERVDLWKPHWPREGSEIFFTAMRIESRFWKRRDVLVRLRSN